MFFPSEVAGDRFVQQGAWDSINVVEVKEDGAAKASYKLTTTVMLHMGVEKAEVGSTTLSGTMTRQVLVFYFRLRTDRN